MTAEAKQKTRRAQWFIFNGLTLATCILGVALHKQPAAYVFQFLIWLSCPAIILCAMSEKTTVEARAQGPSAPPLWTLCVDLAMACICAAYAWFYFATLIGIAAACGYVVHVDGPTTEDKPEAEDFAEIKDRGAWAYMNEDNKGERHD